MKWNPFRKPLLLAFHLLGNVSYHLILASVAPFTKRLWLWTSPQLLHHTTVIKKMWLLGVGGVFLNCIQNSGEAFRRCFWTSCRW